MKQICLQISLWLAIGCSVVHAQEFKRFEFSPYGGYTVSGDVSLETDDNAKITIRINSAYNVGANFGVNINEQDSIEASWQRQFTEGGFPSGIVDPSC